MAGQPSPSARFARGFGWQAASPSVSRRLSTEAHVCVPQSEGGPQSRSHTSAPFVIADNRSFQDCAADRVARHFWPDFVRQAVCSARGMARWFVYVLKNAANPPRYYTGHTSDVATRQAEHNAGSSIHSGLRALLEVRLRSRFARRHLR